MKILGYDYSVDMSDDQRHLGSAGECDTGIQRIRIASDQHDQAKCSTALHEIIEALNYHLALKLEHNIIASLESGLYQVLSDAGIDLSPLIAGVTP